MDDGGRAVKRAQLSAKANEGISQRMMAFILKYPCRGVTDSRNTRISCQK